MEGLIEAATLERADTVLTAVVGMVGLRPTLAAIRQGKRIALGQQGDPGVRRGAGDGGRRRPRRGDRAGGSEHSAIFQCLQGSRDRGEVKRLILTASGGPFWGWEKEKIASATVEQALKHPNWSMGPRSPWTRPA